ncbi:MAG: hypothetical protein ABW139_05100 [Candidatus Thiodiazotropha sp. DIVDIV]
MKFFKTEPGYPGRHTLVLESISSIKEYLPIEINAFTRIRHSCEQ